MATAALAFAVAAWRSNLERRRLQKALVPGIAALMHDAYDQGLVAAARAVASLAERPYDNEPEFSAMLHAEHVIRAMMQAGEKR